MVWNMLRTEVSRPTASLTPGLNGNFRRAHRQHRKSLPPHNRKELETMKRTLAAVSIAAALSGCNPIIPTGTIHVTESLSYTYAQVLVAAVVIGTAYYIVDPLAPNWKIEATRLDDTRFRIAMRKKSVTTGGDGESVELFHRQAEQLAAEAHSPDYTILSLTEGIDSDFPIAHRWARGVVEIHPGPVRVGMQ
jgi:hypothetical protein